MQNIQDFLYGYMHQSPQPTANARDMTQDNLAAAVASMQRAQNIGLPQALPQTQGGGTDYRAMLQALQGTQLGGQVPGYPGMSGMRFDPGAGFLPHVAAPQMPSMQAQPAPTLPPMHHGAQRPTSNLGLGGPAPWRNIGYVQQR